MRLHFANSAPFQPRLGRPGAMESRSGASGPRDDAWIRRSAKLGS